MTRLSIKKMILAGMFLALAFVLPFLTGQIPQIGNMLLPMHIPVLLCGFVCGWPYGLFVGFVVPILRSLIFAMPPMYPIALAMAFELAVYGMLTGLFYKLFPKKTLFIYLDLILAMIGGRAAWGIVMLFATGIGGNLLSFGDFIAAVFTTAVPGIIVQIVVIPVLIALLQKSKLLPLKE